MVAEYSRLAIWGLDNLLRLESILPLLSKDYNHLIDFLVEEQLDIRDKTLFNQWVNPIQIEEINVLGENIKFISTLGKYEYGYGEDKSFINGELLPRDIRIFNHTVETVFFEFEQKVYCVVETSESQESRIRSGLFGQRKGAKIPEWGKISSQSPLPFQFDSKFFYWLLSKKGNSFQLNGQTINLLDVSAISLLSDRNVYESQSIGPNLLGGSISALSGLGSNENIHLIGLKLNIGDTTLDLRFGKNGVSYVNKTHCYKINEEEHLDFNQSNHYFVLLIYGFIFPELLKQYDNALSDGQWDSEKEAQQRKEWALTVIRNLVEQNSIEEEDIRNLFVAFDEVAAS